MVDTSTYPVTEEHGQAERAAAFQEAGVIPSADFFTSIIEKLKTLDWKWIGLGGAGVWAITSMYGGKGKKRRRR